MRSLPIDGGESLAVYVHRCHEHHCHKHCCHELDSRSQSETGYARQAVECA